MWCEFWKQWDEKRCDQFVKEPAIKIVGGRGNGHVVET